MIPKQTSLQKLKAGFTLIELLVVISIIALLATILLLQLNTARAKGRDAKRITDINQVRTGLELYFDQNNDYPATLADPLLKQYLTQIPNDPLDPATHPYKYVRTSNTQYCVGAYMEAYTNALKSDSDIAACDPTPVNETAAGCSATTRNCVFDLGQP